MQRHSFQQLISSRITHNTDNDNDVVVVDNLINNSRYTSAQSQSQSQLQLQLQYTSNQHHQQHQPQHRQPQQQQQENFHSIKNFVIGTLNTWGLNIGNLSYNKDNQITLNTIVQLINLKQKDLSAREKLKEQINAQQFEKDKYKSFHKQALNTIDEKNKLLGKLENQNIEIKNKIKKTQAVLKKQRQQDRKAIMMIKSKNDQILHQVKKKQTQLTRIKQQMKKSILAPTTKSITNNSSNLITTHINTFELIQKISTQKQQQKQQLQQMNSLQENHYYYMQKKYQQQRKIFIQENNTLKNKYYEVRQILIEFSQWIDKELFGIVKSNFKDSYVVNHYAMFSKGFLTDDLKKVVLEAKNGVAQLQEKLMQAEGKLRLNKGEAQQRMIKKSIGAIGAIGSSQSLRNQQNVKQEGNFKLFKKKSNNISLSNQTQQNQNFYSQFQPKNGIIKKTTTTGATRATTTKGGLSNIQIPSTIQNIPFVVQPSPININSHQISAFQQDIISAVDDQEDFVDDQDIDNSIISYISPQQLRKQSNIRNIRNKNNLIKNNNNNNCFKNKNFEEKEKDVDVDNKRKYDKWDILFAKDQE